MNSEAEPLYLVAGAASHPPDVLGNAELEARLPELDEGWIEERLGIRTRHVLGEHDDLGTLARHALALAIDRAGWSPGSIDMIVGATSFVDDVLPATASWIARDSSPNAIAFDVNAACASAPYALNVASALLHTTPTFRRAAVCAAESPTKWADYEDAASCIYWGDAAACVLVQRGRPDTSAFRVVGMNLLNDNEHPEKVRVPHDGTFAHDGRYSYQQVCLLTEKTVSRVLDDAGVHPRDLRAFVGHQSNVRLLHEVGERIGVGWSQQWHNVEWAGNQGGAGVLSAFTEQWNADRENLRDGDHVVLAAVGGGYTAGAVLLRWETVDPL